MLVDHLQKIKKESKNLYKQEIHDSGIKNENISTKELAEELHKPIIKKINKRKVQSPFIDNVSGADLGDMLLINKFYKGFRFLTFIANMHELFFRKLKKAL